MALITIQDAIERRRAELAELQRQAQEKQASEWQEKVEREANAAEVFRWWFGEKHGIAFGDDVTVTAREETRGDRPHYSITVFDDDAAFLALGPWFYLNGDLCGIGSAESWMPTYSGTPGPTQDTFIDALLWCIEQRDALPAEMPVLEQIDA